MQFEPPKRPLVAVSVVRLRLQKIVYLLMGSLLGSLVVLLMDLSVVRHILKIIVYPLISSSLGLLVILGVKLL